MFRRVAVLLTIANLLLCPLVCRGAFSGEDRDVASWKPACDCGMCEHSREVPPDRLPPGDKPCDSCQCVCGGAVSLKNSGPEIDLAVGVWAPISPVDDLFLAERQTGCAARFHSHPPGFSSGRLLRLELVSLLC